MNLNLNCIVQRRLRRLRSVGRGHFYNPYHARRHVQLSPLAELLQHGFVDVAY